MIRQFAGLALACALAACGGKVDGPSAELDAGAPDVAPAFCETQSNVCGSGGCVSEIDCTEGTPPSPDCGEASPSGNSALPEHYRCVTP